MRILMLGWEFPPYISGGLGIASQGLAQALAKSHRVDFLLPKLHKEHTSDLVDLLEAETLFDPKQWMKEEIYTEELRFLEIGVRLLPYLPAAVFEEVKYRKKKHSRLEPSGESDLISNIKLTGKYTVDLQLEITKYALIASQLAVRGEYDVVHCHDWMTLKAGTAVKKRTGTPMIAHIHSTEFDRNGSHGNSEISASEKNGLLQADRIIAVSENVKRTIINHYQIDEDKISVIPNGFDQASLPHKVKKPKGLSLVGFSGRFVHQKDPLGFLDIAREISRKNPNVRFLMSGDGYLMDQVKQKAEEMNLRDKLSFTGFLSHSEMLKTLAHLDVLIVPSRQEPFGLVALEALQSGTPVICSDQAGICEFVPSIPAFARWNIYQFATEALKLVTDPKYAEEVLSLVRNDLSKLTWERTARQVEEVYHKG